MSEPQAGSAIRALGIEMSNDAPSTSHYAFTTEGSDDSTLYPTPPSPDSCFFSGKIVGYYGRAFRQAPPPKAGAAEISPAHSKKVAKAAKNRNIHIPRQELRQILLDRLEPDTIQWNRKFSNYEEKEDGIVVHFEGGESLEGALLVGADGIYSGVRRQMTPESGLNYLGCVVVLGICKIDHPLVHQRVFETVDGTTRLYSMPFTKDLSMWQLSFPLPEAEAIPMSKSAAALKAEALRRCSSWHVPVPEMFQNTDLTSMSGGPVYDRDCLRIEELSSPEGRRVTLLGDAAHPMSPFKGQGANQALLDAVDLAQSLERHGDLTSALTEYEPKMIARSEVKVRASRLCAELQHSPGATHLSGEDETKTEILSQLSKQGINAWSSEAGYMPPGYEGSSEEPPEGMSRLDWLVLQVGGENPGGCSSDMHRKLCSWQTAPDHVENIKAGMTNKKKAKPGVTKKQLRRMGAEAAGATSNVDEAGVDHRE